MHLSPVNAGLAQSEWRSGLIWWLLSLLFGPPAMLLIVVLPKQPDPEALYRCWRFSLHASLTLRQLFRTNDGQIHSDLNTD